MEQTNIHTKVKKSLLIYSNIYLSIPFLAFFLFFFFFFFFFFFSSISLRFFCSPNPPNERPYLVLSQFGQIFLLLHFSPQTPFYLHHNLCHFYNSISSSYLMTFISCFDKFHFYPYILYKFWVSKFSHLSKL